MSLQKQVEVWPFKGSLSVINSFWKEFSTFIDCVTKVVFGEWKNSNVRGKIFLPDNWDTKMWPKHSDCLLRLKLNRAKIESMWKILGGGGLPELRWWNKIMRKCSFILIVVVLFLMILYVLENAYLQFVVWISKQQVHGYWIHKSVDD